MRDTIIGIVVGLVILPIIAGVTVASSWFGIEGEGDGLGVHSFSFIIPCYIVSLFCRPIIFTNKITGKKIGLYFLMFICIAIILGRINFALNY